MGINIDGRICHDRIRALEELANKHKVQKYLEIGVHNGSSMSYVLQSNYIKECVGVDPFETLKDKSSHYIRQDSINETRTRKNIENNNKNSAEIKLIKGYSQDVSIDDTGFDMLFIDGDHSYEMAKHDYEKFIKNVKSGGIIVFDDLHLHGPGKFFEELKNDNRVAFDSIMYETEGVLIKL
jgi:predicted O-methyltransferase YrrM